MPNYYYRDDLYYNRNDYSNTYCVFKNNTDIPIGVTYFTKQMPNIYFKRLIGYSMNQIGELIAYFEDKSTFKINKKFASIISRRVNFIQND